MEAAIRVHCVDQEYWYVKRQKCDCGGDFKVVSQSLIAEKGCHFDSLQVSCENCAASGTFTFDISSFHRPLLSFSKLSEIEEKLKELYSDKEVAMKMSSPMEATIGYIRHLAESNDALALAYIGGAIDQFTGKEQLWT